MDQQINIAEKYQNLKLTSGANSFPHITYSLVNWGIQHALLAA